MTATELQTFLDTLTGDPPEPVVAAAPGTLPTITGYAAVFYNAADPGTEYEVQPGVFERFMPGAFTRTLRTGGIVSTFGHWRARMLGRQADGTLRVWEDEIGLRFELPVPATRMGRRLAESIGNGDVSGASVSFTAVRSADRVEGGRRVVEVTEARVVELGPVNQPAYRAAACWLKGATADADELAMVLAVMTNLDRAEL